MLVRLLDLERAKSRLDCERSRDCVCANDPERLISRTIPDCVDADEARRCRMRCVGSTFGMLATRAKRERTRWQIRGMIMHRCKQKSNDALSTTLTIPHNPPPMGDPGDELGSKSESVTKSLCALADAFG
jgi:hypothetical protein